MKWTGIRSRSTIDKAIKELAELGILEVVRERQRQPRAFRLLVECPEGCERLKDHNTKLERSRQSEPPKTPEATSPEETSVRRLGNHLPQIGQRVSVDWATNRYPIDTSNKKDDMKKSFEILFITETLEALKTSNDYTANHALLEKALLEIPELIEEKAKAIQARAIHSPQKYLLNSITNSPTSLIPKQNPAKTEEDLKMKKFQEQSRKIVRLETGYKELMESFPELTTEALEVGNRNETIRFLLTTCPNGIKTTAALVANKATYYGIEIGHCKTVEEALELTKDKEDLPSRDIQRVNKFWENDQEGREWLAAKVPFYAQLLEQGQPSKGTIKTL
jgi:hypothetical protein